MRDFIRRHATFLMILSPFVLMNLLTISVWSGIPKEMTIGWDFSGHPDAWGSRNFLWLTPGLYLLIAVALRMLTACFPASSSPSNTVALNLLLGGVAGFVLCYHLKLLMFAPYRNIKPGWIFENAALGSFMIMLSASLKVCTPNPILGIRTRWALASAENWRSTHVYAGKMLFWCGLMITPLSISLLPLAPFALHPLVPIGQIFGVLVGSMVYSYQLHKGSKDVAVS